MDPSTSNSVNSELNEDKALGILLDAFGSAYSLEEIASAYCRAGYDVDAAGEILSQFQESRPTTNRLHSCNDTGSNVSSLELGHENAVDSRRLYKNSYMSDSKPKKLTVSMGTVSTVLGKEYSRRTSSRAEPLKASKPMKLELKEPLADDATYETIASDFSSKSDLGSNKDTVDFLFSMLGDGFKLDKDMINDVLGSCGFDVKKTMEHLLAMASSDLDKDKDKVLNYGAIEGLSDRLPILGSQRTDQKILLPSAQRKSAESYGIKKIGSDVPREVLESLFCAPGRSEESPKRTRLQMGLNRTRVVGQKVVSAPYDDIDPKPPADITKEVDHDNKDVEDKEDNYVILRRTTKQSWDIMKAYYGAAVDAFNKGDRANADYLLEQGKLHYKTAREADEKSAREILDSRSTENQNDFILDLHNHHAKEGIKLLKCHLRSFAGIPTYRYMKVIVDTDGEDITKGKRRKMVLKLLERESIEWTEENPGTICIRLDAIEPNKLSFVGDLQKD